LQNLLVAEIYHFPWCEDFAAARNESIKHASGDWILWIDADERLMPESQAALKKLLRPEKHPVLYKIKIRNIKPDGNSYVLSSAHRLFTNNRGMHFSGQIHEQISPSAKAVKAEERSTSVTLFHIGYSFEGEQKKSKQDRNYSILSKMVEQEPENAYAHLTLGHNLKESGQILRAREQYEIALSLNQFDPTMKSTLLNSLADILIDCNELSKADELIALSCNLSPRQNIAYYLKYRAANKNGDFIIAIQALQALLKMIPSVRSSGSQCSTDIDFDLFRIHYSLAGLFAKEEDWDRSEHYYKKVLSDKPEDVETLKRLVHVCNSNQDFLSAEYHLEKLIQLQDENTDYLSTLAILAIKQENYTKAIRVYERLKLIHPDHHEYGRRLAGLYAKTGNIERMLQLI